MEQRFHYLAGLSFVGTNYHGSQIQRNADTIQQRFQHALLRVFGTLPDIKCCSRTDAGVHAKKFFISFFTEASQNCDKLTAALNAHLPRDIRVISVRSVPQDFHARYSAVGKEYQYLVCCGRVMDPFLEGRALHVPAPLDIEKMQQAAKLFLGSHDFSAFCAKRSDVEDKCRTVTEARVEQEGELLRFTYAADGFLYNMARIMTGALLQVGRGKLSCETLAEFLNGRARDNRLITAPACGLYLTEVFYCFDH